MSAIEGSVFAGGVCRSTCLIKAGVPHETILPLPLYTLHCRCGPYTKRTGF